MAPTIAELGRLSKRFKNYTPSKKHGIVAGTQHPVIALLGWGCNWVRGARYEWAGRTQPPSNLQFGVQAAKGPWDLKLGVLGPYKAVDAYIALQNSYRSCLVRYDWVQGFRV